MARITGARAGRAVPLAVGVLLLAVLGAVLVGLTRDAGPAEPALLPVVDADSGGVSAFPAPDTPVASPHSQISLRDVDPDDLGELTVTGSQSGPADGTLVEHSDGEGISFVPAEPFTAREEVTVSTEHDVRGTDGGTYTLTIAAPGTRPATEAPPVRPPGPQDPVRHFRSAPDLQPPAVEVLARSPESTTELVAVGVKNGFVQKGPMLVDPAGEPVWFHPLTGVDARDVKVQTYRGEPVLTWWEGRMPGGYGYGEAVIMDDSYTEVARVPMQGGYDVDSHEVFITDDDTLLVIAYEPVGMDLSAMGGPADGQVVDNIVQEIDIGTGAVLFEWHSVGTIALDESYLPFEDGSPFDYVHANSVDVDDDGNLLVSARHSCTIYKLDRATGSIIWRLGGRESDFVMGEGTTFLKQHDARRSDDGTITLLDNGGTCGETERESTRGLALEVDEQAMTAEVAREYPHPEGLFSSSQANFQERPGGHVLVGWGSLPRWTEMDADGQVLLDMAIPEGLSITSYRAFAVDWEGRPDTGIDAVLHTSLQEGTSLYASWNGSTEVASWRVLAERGPGADAGLPAGAAERDGFETAIELDAEALDPAGLTGLTVQALGDDGQVLRSSPVDLSARATAPFPADVGGLLTSR